MLRDEIETVETTSPNILVEQTEQLKLIFPQVFSEGKVDFKKLRAALGDMVDTQPERYSFTWAGKRNATLLLQTPSYATLTPAEDESVNFESTQNLFIEGDNLEVLKLLYKSYSGRVKMIYIDPPYNTGNDFVYPDNYADPLETYLEISGQKDANGNLLTSNPETSGRYHSAWLSMMYPRLYIARQLLRDAGVIFISIDDHEVYNLRLLMNEIFGEENFVAQVVWQKVYSPRMDAKGFSEDHDYILVYRRSDQFVVRKIPFEQNLKQFSGVSDGGKQYRPRSLRKEGKNSRRIDRPNMYFSITAPDGSEVFPIKPDGTEGRWRWSREKYEAVKDQGLTEWVQTKNGWQVYVKQFYDEKASRPPSTVWTHTEVGHNHQAVDELKEVFGEAIFDNPKPIRLIKRMLELSTDPEDEDIVLDFFAGSCTSAHAILQLNREDNGNRRFIMVQLPEKTDNPKFPTIAEIGKERIRRVISNVTSQDKGKLDLSTREEPEDLGFRVFKLAPSNYKQWKSIDASDPEAYTKQLDMFADLLVDNWNTISVLWEVAVKEGYGLNAQLERLEEVQANAVWRITDQDKDQSMLVCLDDELKASSLSALPLSKEQVFVCRNKALDDTKAANLALQCRLKKI